MVTRHFDQLRESHSQFKKGATWLNVGPNHRFICVLAHNTYGHAIGLHNYRKINVSHEEHHLS